MTFEEIMKLKEGLDTTDTTEPFLVVDNDDIKIVGDPNDTAVRKHDYTLVFESDDGRQTTKVYKDVHVVPRKRRKVSNLLAKILPYFRGIDENGKVRQLTDEEAISALVGMDDEVYDIMYDLAEELLDVPKELIDHITPESIIAFGISVVVNNPPVVRESDSSFK